MVGRLEARQLAVKVGQTIKVVICGFVQEGFRALEKKNNRRSKLSPQELLCVNEGIQDSRINTGGAPIHPCRPPEPVKDNALVRTEGREDGLGDRIQVSSYVKRLESHWRDEGYSMLIGGVVQ